jgi:pathogen-inducible salicylic acid glucosyltransferase
MVTMPGWSDQQTNSKLVEDAWKVGVRAKVDEHGIVKREEIAISIKEVMEGDRGREMKMNSKKWKELAIEATSEGGTSDTNINVMVAMLRSTK